MTRSDARVQHQPPDRRREVVRLRVMVVSSACVTVTALVAAVVDGAALTWFVAAVGAGICASSVVGLRRASRGA